MTREIDKADDLKRRGEAVDHLVGVVAREMKGHYLSTIELSFAVLIEFFERHAKLDVEQLFKNVITHREMMDSREPSERGSVELRHPLTERSGQ